MNYEKFRGEQVAIAGTSLPSIMLTERLIAAGVAAIDIYEPYEVGGAWGGKNMDNYGFLPKHNNVVVPNNERESERLENLLEYLKSFGARVVLSDYTPVGSSDKTSKMICGDFFPFIHQVISHRSITVVRKRIDSVEAWNDTVSINGKRYQRAYLSKNTKIRSLQVHKTPERVPSSSHFFSGRWERNISMHLRAMIRSHGYAENLDRYSERSDGVFDRWGFRPGADEHGPNFLFIGRVARQKKHLDLQDLIAESRVISSYSSMIEQAELNFYKQDRLHPEDFYALESLVLETPIDLMEHSDLMSVSNDILGGLGKTSGGCV